MNKKRDPVAGIATGWRAPQKANLDALRNSRITLSGSTNKAPENLTGNGTVADNLLIDRLAQQVLHWRVGPDRFLTGDRSWLPKWRFDPLTRLDDAFDLLERSGSSCRLGRNSSGIFTVEVRFSEKVGKASGPLPARVVTYAIARMLGVLAGTGRVEDPPGTQLLRRKVQP